HLSPPRKCQVEPEAGFTPAVSRTSDSNRLPPWPRRGEGSAAGDNCPPRENREMPSGARGRIYSGRLPARHLPIAFQCGRGEGRVPRRGGSVPPPKKKKCQGGPGAGLST